MVKGTDIKFTFYSKIFVFVVGAQRGRRWHTHVHKRLFEVHDRVRKHVIRFTKNMYQDF